MLFSLYSFEKAELFHSDIQLSSVSFAQEHNWFLREILVLVHNILITSWHEILMQYLKTFLSHCKSNSYIPSYMEHCLSGLCVTSAFQWLNKKCMELNSMPHSWHVNTGGSELAAFGPLFAAPAGLSGPRGSDFEASEPTEMSCSFLKWFKKWRAWSSVIWCSSTRWVRISVWLLKMASQWRQLNPVRRSPRWTEWMWRFNSVNDRKAKPQLNEK